MQRDRRGRRQVIGDRRRRVEEERQVVFDAAGDDAVGDVLIERGFRWVAFEHLAKAAAEARASGIVQRKFARRQQAHVGDRIERTLRVDVERLDGFDFGIEEIDAER